MPGLPKPGGDSTPKRDYPLASAFRLFYRAVTTLSGSTTVLAEVRRAKMTLYHHFAPKEGTGEEIEGPRALNKPLGRHFLQ